MLGPVIRVLGLRAQGLEFSHPKPSTPYTLKALKQLLMLNKIVGTTCVLGAWQHFREDLMLYTHSQVEVQLSRVFVKDEMTLQGRGPFPLYMVYEPQNPLGFISSVRF